MECIRILSNRQKIIDALITNPRDMRPDQVEYLPKKQLLKLDPWQIEGMWGHLPKRYKKDRDVQLWRPCYEHYLPEHESHVDGPPPPKRTCLTCSNNRRLMDITGKQVK